MAVDLQADPVGTPHPAARCCWCQAALVVGVVVDLRCWLCPTCWRRQVAHALIVQPKAGLRICLNVPLPSQVLFEECPAKNILWGGQAGPGKAVTLDMEIPTPHGFRRMADLRVGDAVLGETGTPCTVTWKSAVHTDPAGTFRITFDDGSVVVAGGSHEWLTWTAEERAARLTRSEAWRARRRATRGSRAVATSENQRPWTTAVLRERNALMAAAYVPTPVTGSLRTTAQIAATLTVRHGSRINHSIPLAGLWACPTQTLPLDPYVLGAWLGDGNHETGILTTSDPEILYELLQAGFPVRPQPSHQYAWRVEGLTARLRAVGVLSHKHMPHAYLWAAIPQRLALLQGLMDTDGTCDRDAGCVFTNTNAALALGVWHLAVSLGLKARWRETRAVLNGRDCGPNYEVRWTSPLAVFRLPRKAAKLPTTVRATQRQRYIVACDRIADQPVQCIEVDNPSHLYLVGDAGIPTHNSHGVRHWLYKRSLMIPDHKALLLRENSKQLETTHLFDMKRELPKLDGKLVDDVARFPNGAEIHCGHMADEGAVQRYLGTEYGIIVGEEGSLYPVNAQGASTLSELRTRARKNYVDLNGQVVAPKFVVPSNPGGPSSAYLCDMFVDHTPDYERYPRLRPVFNDLGVQIKGYRPEQWAYLPARLEDNPYMREDYRESDLAGLSDVRYKQLADGDWHAFAGAFFGEWSEMREGKPWHVRRFAA